MDDEKISEEFFDNLQPLNNHFTDAFYEKSENSFLMEDLSLVTDRYDDGGQIGSGGMKQISSTTDAMTLRQVAKAKLKKQDYSSEERFIKEARLTASLEHPNIIPIYDLGLEKGEPFFTMKLIEGENLSDLISKMKNQGVNFSLQDLMQIFLKICDAVAYAHSKRVIHLDIKPSNIRLGQFGEVIVCDWGLAKIIGDAETQEDTVSLDPNLYNDLTLDGVVKGSPGYLAPEQISKEFGSKDEQTDIYALGGILYNMLTLRSPTHSKDVNKCLKQTVEGEISDPLKFNPKLPQSLCAVAMKALSTEKDDRYTSVVELRKEINLWLNGFTTIAEEAGFVKSLWFLFRRHKAVSVLSLLMLFISAFLSAKILDKQRDAIVAENLYLTEKENSRKQAEEDVPRFLESAIQGYKDYDFDKSLEYATIAVKKNPDSDEAWNMKGRIHVIRQEFNAALEAFSYLPNRRAKRLRELSVEYGQLKEDNEFLPINHLKDFLVRLAHVQYTYLICGYIDNKSDDLEYRVQAAFIFMQDIVNRHVKNWDVSYEVRDGYVELDLSKTTDLQSLTAVRKLPVSKLNIANTRIGQTLDIINLPLVEINLTNTPILDPRPILHIPTLKKVIIHRSQFRNVNFPKRIEVKRVR